MGKYDLALKKLQNERLEAATGPRSAVDLGYISGIEKAEEIIFEMQKQSDLENKNLWYTGCPNDLKPNNRGTYILIMRAEFDSDDGVEKGKLYIDTDFWDGEKWEGFEVGDDRWTVLYFTKLKWLKFPLPDGLEIEKRSDVLFFD